MIRSIAKLVLVCVLVLPLSPLSSVADEDSWYPSKSGADDTLGAINELSSAGGLADAAWEFLFVLGQPKFVGAVQMVINPIAIR